MANKTIAQLTAASAAALTNLFEIDDGSGGSFKLTVAQLQAILNPSPNGYISGLRLGSVSSSQLSISVGACEIPTGGIYQNATTFTLNLSGLANSTVYHVYGFVSAGVLSFDYATTAPVVYFGTARNKTADTGRRYIASFITDSGGVPLPFAHIPNTGEMYYFKCPTADPYRVLNGGTASTSTAISLSSVVPVTADAGYFRISNSDTAVTLNFGLYEVDDATGDVSFFVPALAALTARSLAWLPLASQQIFYKFASAPTGSGTVVLQAYHFLR